MGKIVGGTSRLNNMLYVRGHPSDYKDWYKDQEGFDYERDVLYYFKKMEDSTGPFSITEIPFSTVLSDAILKAAESLGFAIRNVNDKHSTGFMKPQVNIKQGARYTTGHYLLDHKKTNLHIQTQALAYKILFKDNYEAYGIKFMRAHRNFTVTARSGIILSAGVIGTPKLLMLSGIGTFKHLKNMGITPKIDLPVGENLQDHVTTGLDLITLNTSLGISIEDSLNPRVFFDYVFHGTGLLTYPGCEVIGIVNEENKIPELQLMVIPLGISNDGGIHIRKTMGISDESFAYFSDLTYENVATVLPIVLHPKSRGTVRLRDKNVASDPIINPEYLSQQYDVEMLLKGISLIKKLLQTRYLQELGASLNKNHFPGCESHVFDSRDYWECYVRHLTITSYHPVGTCRFGRIDDENAVVDFDFRVRGVNRLFVVDASVMPSLPSGNVNAAVVMLAEKAADVVKRWKHLEDGACFNSEIFVPRIMC